MKSERGMFGEGGRVSVVVPKIYKINEFVFSNANVFAEYMKQKQIELWRSLFGTSATDNPFINNYQIPAPDYSVR